MGLLEISWREELLPIQFVQVGRSGLLSWQVDVMTCSELEVKLSVTHPKSFKIGDWPPKSLKHSQNSFLVFDVFSQEAHAELHCVAEPKGFC